MTGQHWTKYARGAQRDGRGGMNRTEAAYRQVLELRKHAGEVLWFGFHCIKFKLADSTWYEPDFLVMLADGMLEIHEVKGFTSEKAWIKLKVAAEAFPIRFIVVKRDGKQWSLEAV